MIPTRSGADYGHKHMTCMLNSPHTLHNETALKLLFSDSWFEVDSTIKMWAKTALESGGDFGVPHHCLVPVGEDLQNL